LEKVDISQVGELEERVIWINYVSKTVKGGKRQKIAVLAAVGDGQGHVGVAMGKAQEYSDALAKAVERAKKRLVRVPRWGTTIPYEVVGEFGSSKVIIKPAAPGTGVIAGLTVRAILELVGVKDVLTKVLGSTNPPNVAWAVLEALSKLRDPSEVAALRGKDLRDIWGEREAIGG
jgi:small subunit ribosomal protein S5